jgi:hypothetical protein
MFTTLLRRASEARHAGNCAFTAAAVTALLWQPVTSLTGATTVPKLTYEIVRVEKPSGQTEVIERGSLIVAPDGRHRSEIVDKDGRLVIKIELPAIGERIELDPAARKAFVGSLAKLWSSRPGDKSPLGRPSGMSVSSDMRKLGSKTVDGVELDGLLQTTSLSGPQGNLLHTMEIWNMYFADARIPPILVEQRFEAADEVVDRRLLQVERIAMTETMFEVPAGYSVVHLR